MELDDQVAAVRAFNRMYTRTIGVLESGLAGTPFSLTEARVLYELAHAGDVVATELRRELGLDAGYLSRILGRLTRDGLAVREPSTTDARKQVIRLTAAGRTAFGELDAAQSAAVGQLLSGIAPDDRSQLVDALGTARNALGGKAGPTAVTIRAPEPGDYGWVVARHGALYAREYGWNSEFEALVARIVADHIELPASGRAAAWIAEVDGRRAGSVFCVPGDRPDVAKLRLLLVEPSARGRGVGGRLVDECLAFARRAGYRRITLWTNDVLTAARRIYERAGFELDGSEPHRSYGADLVGQTFSRDL